MSRWWVLAFVLCACGAVCPDDKDVNVSVVSGTFVPTEQRSDCVTTPLMPSTNAEQHQLEISADRKQVTETWQRSGRAYKVVYDVTKTESF